MRSSPSSREPRCSCSRASDTDARKARYRTSNRPFRRSGMSFTCHILASLRNIGEDHDAILEAMRLDKLQADERMANVFECTLALADHLGDRHFQFASHATS